jgi:hypothetical protein
MKDRPMLQSLTPAQLTRHEPPVKELRKHAFANFRSLWEKRHSAHLALRGIIPPAKAKSGPNENFILHSTKRH